MPTTIAHPASSRTESDDTLPPDLDPEINPIIATHFYGVDLRDVRQVFWNFARQGHRLSAESNVILIPGGRP